MRPFDTGLAREASAGVVDTRHWVSYGTVEPDSPSARSVTFSDAYGPLVSVKLHPTGIPVVCRVSHEVAGNGEGEWFPFLAGDEVMVAIPEGDETAGCVIFGRLNQEIDKFPGLVAGQDPSLNNFAFRRLRTPYIFETASTYLLRCATTGAYLSINDVGAITLSNSDSAFLALTADFIGLQNKTADVLMQIAVENKQLMLQAMTTQMVLDAKLSYLYTKGILQLGTSGNQAAWHATSLESVVVLLAAMLAAIGTTDPGPLTGTGLAAGAIPILTAAIEAAASLPVAPFLAAISTALKTPMVPGTNPGVGTPGLLIG